MNIKEQVAVGADPGYHTTKIAFVTGTYSFPSAVGAPPADYGQADLGVSKVPFHMFSPYNLLIGRAAKMQGVGEPDLSPEWFKSPSYFALLMAGLVGTSNLVDERYLAVVGLPVDYMGLKDELEAHYAGGHRVSFSGKIQQHVELEIKVVSQGVGALATQIIQDGGLIPAGKRHLIERPDETGLTGLIDSGSGTTCYLGAHGLSTVADLTGSIPVAAWEIERIARKMLRDEYGPSLVSGMPRHALMERLRLDAFTDRGQRIKTAHILKDASAIVAGKIVSHLTTVWGESHRQMERIYITGGGGMLIAPFVQRAFPQARLIPGVDPIFANAIGYRRIAEMLKARG
jgi:hypothetical protein